MNIRQDFECGGARRGANLAKSHWRPATTGDASGCAKRFGARIAPEPCEAGSILRY